MTSDDQFEQYYRDGYVILEDVIKPDRLAHVQEAYEETIEDAMAVGGAERDDNTQALKGYRFQNPHHPALAQRALMESIGAPELIEFAERICAGDLALLGIAAFAMNSEYEYLPDWNRDSYAAWGKD